jgi:HSP20 family protein
LTNSPFIKDYSAYPGEYRPPPFQWKELRKELNKPPKGGSRPKVNISECADYYKIEIAAPGHCKEDFIIGIKRNKLSIVVLQQKKVVEEQYSQLQEFNYHCFAHSIDLPQNADPDFVRAEYTEGILCMCFTKTEQAALTTVHQVIVY